LFDVCLVGGGEGAFGSVRFSETLGAFQLANPDGSEVVLPQENIEGALAKLRLFQTGMTPETLRSGFNTPFNTMFMPAEYLTINCCPECYIVGHTVFCPPCEPEPPPSPSTPTNFVQTNVRDIGNGVLQFSYSWDSTSGSLADLSNCLVRENVTYPGTGGFHWPSPPYAVETAPNPTFVTVAGTDGGFEDQQHAGFMKPYVFNQFTANQKFQYMCTDVQNGAWRDFPNPPGSIVRTVEQAPIVWRYTVTKSGSSASMTLP
jgi:hypothetical protein